jgi:hypothetical protein
MKMSDALARALPKFRGLAADELLVWCANELQGYGNGLEFYQSRSHDLPPYRVVAGHLKVVHQDGSWGEIAHPLAQRNEFFLSAPLSWLEDFSSIPGESSVVDLPELTNYIGRQLGGTIVCECRKSELERILGSFRENFAAALNEVINVKMSKSAKQSADWESTASTFMEPANPSWIPDDLPGNAPQFQVDDSANESYSQASPYLDPEVTGARASSTALPAQQPTHAAPLGANLKNRFVGSRKSGDEDYQASETGAPSAVPSVPPPDPVTDTAGKGNLKAMFATKDAGVKDKKSRTDTRLPAMPGNTNSRLPAMPGNTNSRLPAMPSNTNSRLPAQPSARGGSDPYAAPGGDFAHPGPGAVLQGQPQGPTIPTDPTNAFAQSLIIDLPERAALVAASTPLQVSSANLEEQQQEPPSQFGGPGEGAAMPFWKSQQQNAPQSEPAGASANPQLWGAPSEIQVKSEPPGAGQAELWALPDAAKAPNTTPQSSSEFPAPPGVTPSMPAPPLPMSQPSPQPPLPMPSPETPPSMQAPPLPAPPLPAPSFSPPPFPQQPPASVHAEPAPMNTAPPALPPPEVAWAMAAQNQGSSFEEASNKPPTPFSFSNPALSPFAPKTEEPDPTDRAPARTSFSGDPTSAQPMDFHSTNQPAPLPPPFPSPALEPELTPPSVSSVRLRAITAAASVHANPLTNPADMMPPAPAPSSLFSFPMSQQPQTQPAQSQAFAAPPLPNPPAPSSFSPPPQPPTTPAPMSPVEMAAPPAIPSPAAFQPDAINNRPPSPFAPSQLSAQVTAPSAPGQFTPPPQPVPQSPAPLQMQPSSPQPRGPQPPAVELTTPDFTKKQPIMSKSGVNWAAAAPPNPMPPPTPAVANLISPVLENGTTPSISPVISATIKAKATELMVQAYGTKDWVIATKELGSPDPATRELAIGAFQYLIKMNWAGQSANPNVVVLTKDGARQVEKSLTF